MTAARTMTAGRKGDGMNKDLKAFSADYTDYDVVWDGEVGGFDYFTLCKNEIDDELRSFFGDALCPVIIQAHALGMKDITFSVPANRDESSEAPDAAGRYVFAAETEDSKCLHVYVSYVDKDLASSGKVCPFGVITVPKQLDEAVRIAKEWFSNREKVDRTISEFFVVDEKTAFAWNAVYA